MVQTTRPERIAMVAGLPARPGGTETACVRLSQTLIARGHAVRIYAPEPGPSMYQGVPVSRYGQGWLPVPLSLAFMLYRDRRHFDLIHVHLLSRLAFIAMLVGKLARKPLIISMKGGNERDIIQMMKYARLPGFLSWLDPLMWKLIARADYIITVSEPIVQDLVAESVDREHIQVIHNGVPSYPAVPLRDNPLRPARVVSVALLRQQKRLDVLLEAVALLGNPPIHVTLVGDGPMRARLEELAKRLDIDDQVVFAGYVPDAPATCLSQADLFVLSSDFEGMPNALLEAMASGLPCVATGVGGVLEIVEHERTGLLVPPGDPEALAWAISRLIEDEALRHSLGRNARDFVLNNFTIEKAATRHQQVYRAVLGSRTNGKSVAP